MKMKKTKEYLFVSTLKYGAGSILRNRRKNFIWVSLSNSTMVPKVNY